MKKPKWYDKEIEKYYKLEILKIGKYIIYRLTPRGEKE